MSKTYTDLQNNFPDSVDTLDKMQDLNTSTKTMADRYYSMVEANNITGANEYLVQNPSLALSVLMPTSTTNCEMLSYLWSAFSMMR